MPGSSQAMPNNFDFSGLTDSPEDLAKAKEAARAAGVPGACRHKYRDTYCQFRCLGREVLYL